MMVKYVVELSLKEMALRTVAVAMWNSSDILASISKLRLECYESKRGLGEIIDKVKDKVSKLKLPESLTKQMTDVVRPIAFELRRWNDCHEVHLTPFKDFGLHDSVKLRWTTAGTIDYVKTAEKLVRCDALYVERRFRIACFYCLEDYIPLLWEELPKRDKEYFFNPDSFDEGLTFYWACTLKGKLSKLDYLWRTSDRNVTSYNQYAFHDSAVHCNKAGAEYFYHKLTHEEKEASLMRTARDVIRYSAVFFYLLSLMSPAQQMEIVKAQPVDFLMSFLTWPRQDLFLENAGLVWTFLSPSSYSFLLKSIAFRFRGLGLFFPIQFQDFLMQSPSDFKKCLVADNYFHALSFLFIYLEFDDLDSIKVIFRIVDSADRVKLVLNRRVLELFYDHILRDRWPVVEVCLREATMSKEDMERVKKVFEEYIESDIRGRIEWENRSLKKFCELVDRTDACCAKKEKENSEM